MQAVAIDLSEAGENVPGFLLWQVSKLWQRHLNANLKDLKLSSTQAVILGNVVRSTQQGHVVTQIMLSHITKIDRVTTSTAIRSLERKALIHRSVPSDNKRAYIVSPTEKGQQVAMDVLQRFIQAHMTFFHALEQDIGGFAANLQTLKQANDTKLN